MADYIALIHKDADSAFGVSFPDLPGCISVGETLEEARANAEEALALHVEGMIEDGETLPAPSALDEVMAAPGNRDGVVILVPLKTVQPRTVRVNITLPETTLREIDAFAETYGYTRSGLLARAAKQMIDAA
ncbi:type II toxin-antitoxin system HicB family antitoxin [Caulobacter vibrioides]|uniref:DNA-binding protein, CopG family n=2 Tax=Caulobacter vibrioides TaxID=155892 RepID=Q9A3L8_CAUVC|nr:type II toxin-antitoxin system HicB family antitoxin [Caulobacter vibrioides]YP_002518661.1 type II toxin-antitoxin system HicB family antitoxin [Caulobacter vibrioides NA1000]AAK25147.1 DNA-binding protein, CopG family [Caulobacter vibrioides CB15]ACL96753.1 type II toxin-antitoxin system HicB family antitoxin [Caulobacter vibrioides NA1000]ATC26071.1 type II toxin-antitoxin system HicB family antitoxin [Caulobacter vibrioides]ATC30012.1 type II toxin-antitoxin system HicB family antitoxin